jgi:hypothetical protein
VAAVAASSARFHVYKVYLRLLGSHDGTRLSRDGIHLTLCLALLRDF